MAGSKEIRNKIKSVQSTRKITKAMEMVAASKMKKAQDRMRASRPYLERVFNIDGMGYLGYTAILQRDYPVALGILVIGSLLMLVGNILSDIIYALVDPRIRFQ